MLQDNLVLVITLALGIIGNSKSVAAASGILLIMKFLNLDYLFPIVEERGLDIGILFLVLAILVPIARGKIKMNDITCSLRSVPGLFALISGAFMAYISSVGIGLLEDQPDIVIGLVVGTILGVCFFRGVPVGPVNAAGFTAILLLLFD